VSVSIQRVINGHESYL